MEDIDPGLMRKSCSILGDVLRHLSTEFVRPGLSAKNIADEAEKMIRSHKGAVPAFLGYEGFPGSCCVSINEQVVHGIPGNRIINEGDIVSVDCGVLYAEHYSDACRTIIVGEVDDRTKSLVEATEKAMYAGIEKALPGNRIGDISFAIQKEVVKSGFKVSLDFVGHGIGRVLHGRPQVPNYGPPQQGPLLEIGRCYAIEPVVFDGPTRCFLDPDGWTVYSAEKNLSAHFEQTVLITEDGPEILTK